MNLADDRAVFTVEETAEVLRISRGAAYQLARRGDLRVLRLGRTLRVPRGALEELLNGGASNGALKTNGTGANGAVTKGGVLNHGHRTSRGR